MQQSVIPQLAHVEQAAAFILLPKERLPIMRERQSGEGGDGGVGLSYVAMERDRLTAPLQ